MAHQLLGRSIQSAFSIISHINSLYRPPPPLPPPFSRGIPNQRCGWPESGLSEARLLSISSYLPSTATFQGNAAVSQEKFQENDIEGEFEEFVFDEEGSYNEDEDNDIEKHNVVFSVAQKQIPSHPAWKTPELTVKEKKELGAYAHSLGKKLKCQQLKVHHTCPDEMDFVASKLQVATHSVVVGQIGRTLILYRPSLCKSSAVEKKKPPQRVKRSRITKSAGRVPKSRLVEGEEGFTLSLRLFRHGLDYGINFIYWTTSISLYLFLQFDLLREVLFQSGMYLKVD